MGPAQPVVSSARRSAYARTRPQQLLPPVVRGGYELLCVGGGERTARPPRAARPDLQWLGLEAGRPRSRPRSRSSAASKSRRVPASPTGRGGPPGPPRHRRAAQAGRPRQPGEAAVARAARQRAPDRAARGAARTPRSCRCLVASRRIVALLVPSTWQEPFGLVLIEAALAGCPWSARAAAPCPRPWRRKPLPSSSQSGDAAACADALALTDAPETEARAARAFERATQLSSDGYALQAGKFLSAAVATHESHRKEHRDNEAARGGRRRSRAADAGVNMALFLPRVNAIRHRVVAYQCALGRAVTRAVEQGGESGTRCGS